LQVVVTPSAQTIGAPAVQVTMSQPSVPANAIGQCITQ